MRMTLATGSEGDVPGSLAQEAWEKCSQYEVTLSFLRSEWDKWPLSTSHWDRRLIGVGADVQSDTDNRFRAQLVWELRRPLLCHIPPDTTWFSVRYLRRWHYRELRSINHIAWLSSSDENELERVALRATEDCWEPKDESYPSCGTMTELGHSRSLRAITG
jgi:hypothetical protein